MEKLSATTGEEASCSMCRLEGPTRKYTGGPPGAERTEQLCEFCAACFVTNALFFPADHVGKFYLYHAIMYVGRRLFLELQALRRELRGPNV